MADMSSTTGPSFTLKPREEHHTVGSPRDNLLALLGTIGLWIWLVVLPILGLAFLVELASRLFGH